MRTRLPLLVLTTLVAAGGAWLLPDLIESSVALVLTGVVAVALLMAAGVWFRAEKQLPLLCDPLVIFFAFQAQFFVIGPLSLPAFDYHIHFPIAPTRVALVLAGCFLMTLSFLSGYHLRLGDIIGRALPDFRGGRLKLPGWWFEAAILTFGFIGCAVYIWGLGGLESIVKVGYGLIRSSSLYLIPVQALIVGTLIMAWRLVNARPVRVTHLAIFAAVLIAELAFFGLILGARKRLFYLFFGLFTIWLLRQGRSRLPRLVAAGAMAVLLVFFTLWGNIRSRPLGEVLAGRSDPIAAKREGPVIRGYLFSVAEPFAIACLVTDLFPEHEPYRYGRTLLVTLLGFIPRAVWPDKPVGLAKELTRYTDGVFYEPIHGHTVTPTLLGDFYVNFGVLGLIVGGLAYGIACRTATAYSAAGLRAGKQTTAARVLVSAVFLAGLVEARSDTATVLAFYAITYPLLLVGLLFFRFDRPETETRP